MHAIYRHFASRNIFFYFSTNGQKSTAVFVQKRRGARQRHRRGRRSVCMTPLLCPCCGAAAAFTDICTCAGSRQLLAFPCSCSTVGGAESEGCAGACVYRVYAAHSCMHTFCLPAKHSRTPCTTVHHHMPAHSRMRCMFYANRAKRVECTCCRGCPRALALLTYKPHSCVFCALLLPAEHSSILGTTFALRCMFCFTRTERNGLNAHARVALHQHKYTLCIFMHYC